MTKERFFVWLPCKRYVKAYLVRNFSASDRKWPDGVNLSSSKELFAALKERLRKPSYRYDKRMTVNSKYSDRVPLEITEDMFYRYGWELSPTDINDFNQMLEARIKSEMMSYMEISLLFTQNIKRSIRGFYRKSGFKEAEWPEESIRRYFYRHRSPAMDENDVIEEKINKIFMVNMSHK